MINTKNLREQPMYRVEAWWNNGLITESQWEAYMHCWAVDAPRFSNVGQAFEAVPTDKDVLEHVAIIRETA